MLVLTRKKDERIRILMDREALEALLAETSEKQPAEIGVTIVKIRANTVRVGVEAHKKIRVVRSEIPPVENQRHAASNDSGDISAGG